MEEALFFCVAGAEKALTFGLTPLMSALLGMVTGVGGGIVRDVLLAKIPTVLRAELYAVAALAGAGVVVVGHILELPTIVCAVVGGVVCFSIRIAALRRAWQLPVATVHDPATYPDEQ